MKPPPSIPAEQEQRWIEAAGRGDQAAFESLIHLYEKKVFALTTRLCGNPEDAREAAQEAFLAVWQGLPAYRGDARFSTWLYRLTANACMDLLAESAVRLRRRPLAGRSGAKAGLSLSGGGAAGGRGAEGASRRH